MHTIARRLSFLLAGAAACVLVSAAGAQEAAKPSFEPEASATEAAPVPESPAAGQAAPAPAASPAAEQTSQPSPQSEPPAQPAAPLAHLIKDKLASPPSGADEQAAKEFAALTAFYEARAFTPVWVSETGPLKRSADVIAALEGANAYGLEASDFDVPALEGVTDPEKLAAGEIALTRTALLYARHARGGRIMKPPEMLNSNLDRKPQLIDPRIVLDGLAGADNPGTYLTATHPKHPQFEKLRQAFLTAGGAEAKGDERRSLSTGAKRIRANMEMWRWMWEDMGELYVFNNIPEFMQYVYRDGEVIRAEKIVAGMIDKQSSIFSRHLKHVVLRPQWRVPESIMVHELWPSLLRGGGLMRQYGLQIQTKDGRVLDWRKIDWAHDDIRNYHVMQPPGPKSVLGVVKFSFPSQHTIFMHDTPDKWMFRSAQRTHSHGCLRVWKPVELAEILLAYDKGWDKAKVAELIRSGPLDNEVEIDKRIPIHLVYFTAWVDDKGKMRAFADVYGHERRIIQALDGDWSKIAKGRDHLAPPQPKFNPKAVASSPGGTPATQRKKSAQTTGDLLSDVFGGLSF
jgi:murein L,D-transpeptidase YcbB/YkuD